MKILFFSSFPIYKNEGGVQRVTSILSQEFLKLNEEVFYLTSAQGNEEIIENITQYYLPNEGLAINKSNIEYTKNLLYKLQIDVLINQAGIYTDVINFVSEVVHGSKVKLVTVHHNCISCLQQNYRNIILSESNTLSNILRHIDYVPVWHVLKKINKKKYGNMFQQAIIKSDKLMLLSPSYISELKEFSNPIDIAKVQGIANPETYEPQVNCLAQKENRLLFVGRIEYAQKQAHLLISIWEKISNKFPDWEFDILGDGIKLQEMKQMAMDKKLSRINFHGYKDPKPFLEKAKIFTLVSAFEGYPMVLVESQSYGVIPIAFNSFSAIKDIISNNCGIIIPAFNLDVYISKLEALMLDKNMQQKLANEALKNATNFSASKIANQWMNFLNTTIN